MSSGEVNKGTVLETDKKITQAGYDSCSTRLMPPKAVVVALAGQGRTRGTVARTRIALCTNQSLCSIVCNSEVESDFLYYFLRTQYQQLRSVSSGDGTRGGLNLQMIRSYRIPVPPLEIQREIVRVLDTFAELEEELEVELEARKRQYSHYRDSLLAFDASEVPWMTLGEVGRLVRGNGLPKTDFREVGVGAIHYGQIYTRYGTWTTETISFVSAELAVRLAKVDPGDLIITNTSENLEDVGKTVAWLGTEQIVTGGHATVLKHRQSPKFLAYWFQTPEFFAQKKRLATGTKVIDVSASNLAKIRVPLPPLTEQERIVAILDSFDTLVNDLSIGLPAELAARRKQYEHYRDRLLTFEERPA
jgi:type I restriction enzyme S subunit